MNAHPLTRLHQPELLSRIGGAAQGGSAKPKQEREEADRKHGLEPEDSPAGADTVTPDTTNVANEQRGERGPDSDRSGR